MKDLRAKMFNNEKEAYFNVEEVFLKYGYLQIYIITSMNQRKANHFKVTLQTFILVNWTKCPLWTGKIRDNFQGIPFFLLVQYMLTPLSLLSRLESQDNWPSTRDLQYKNCSKASQLFSHNCETCIKQKKAIEKPNVSCKK